MTDNNNIEDLFKDAFSNFEAPVDASLWKGIEKTMGQPSAPSPGIGHTVTNSVSSVKVWALIAAAAALGVASYTLFKARKKAIPEYTFQTNNNSIEVIHNSGSVSATITQPTPEKIVVGETQPVSATRKQSSPDLFTPTIKDKKESAAPEAAKPEIQLSVPLSADKAIAPKPSEAIIPSKDNTEEMTVPAASHQTGNHEQQVPATVNPAPTEVNTAEKVYPFPGQETQSFTPNGDGKNDVFQVLDNEMESVTVKIRNVSGKLVYLSNEIGGGWNGQLQNGNDAPEGLYIVFINGTGLDGKKYSRITRLLLKRN